MAHVTVNNSKEIFGSKVSIADLAVNSFTGQKSDDMTIYTAEKIVRDDWRDELEDLEMEYLCGITATFKDGSKLLVSAWKGL